MVLGERTVDRYLKMRLERKIEVHVEEKLGNGFIDKDMGNMAVKRLWVGL